MKEQIESALTRLADISALLDVETEQANVMFGAIEDKLNDMRLGCTGKVIIHQDMNMTCWLGYGQSEEEGLESERARAMKRNPKMRWGLYVFENDRAAGSLKQWAVRRAPRRYRVDAVPCIPALLEVLIVNARNLTRDLAKAAITARGYAEVIDAVQKEE